MSHTSPVTGPGTIVVQIAAVSREDDAVALAGALRKKNYNVFRGEQSGNERQVLSRAGGPVLDAGGRRSHEGQAGS